MKRFLSFLLAIIFAIQTIGQITNFPWTENFDGAWSTNVPGNSSAPSNWININGGSSTTYLWKKCTTSSRIKSGTGSAEMYVGGSATSTSTYIHSDWLITPQFTLTGNESIRFFVSSNEGSSVGTYTQDLGIYIYNVTTNGHDILTFSDTNLFTPVMPTTTLQGYSTSTWIEYELNLNQFSGNYRLAFVRNKLKGGNYLNIDDLSINTIPACARPISLLTSNITSNGANISFTPGHNSDASWYIYYKTTTSTTWDSILSLTTNYYLNNLNPSSNYQYYIKTNCTNSLSEASPTRYFTTLCTEIFSLPFSEDFNSYSTSGYLIPMCWTRNSTYANRPYITSGGYNGNYLQFYIGTLGTNNIISTPPFDTSIHVNTLRAKFKYKKSNDTHLLYVGVMTNPLDSNTFVTIDTVKTPNISAWENYEVYFDKYQGNGQYISFKMGSSGPNWQYAYLDNLEISQIPTCKAPRNSTVSKLTSSTATINWTPRNQTDNSFWIYYKELLGLNIDSAYVNSDTLYNIINLNPGKDYIYYIKTNCGSDLSEPSFEGSFRTSCIGITSLPYIENFDTYGTGSGIIPSCWERNSSLQTSPYITTICYSSPGSLLIGAASNNRSVAISRPIDSTILMNTLRVKFKMNYSALNNSVQLGVMTDPLDWNTFTPVGSPINITATNIWQDRELTLESYLGTGRYIALYASSGNSIYIDDFIIDYIPNCAKPKNLGVSSITTSSATISWVEGHVGDNSWTLFYKKSLESNYDSVIITNNTSHTLFNLQDATTYNYYLRTNCPTEISEPTFPESFLTTCGETLKLPYYENFDSYIAGTSSYPLCWQKNVTSSSSGAPYIGSSYYSSPNSLYMYAGSFNRCSAIIKKFDSTINLNTLLVKFRMYSPSKTTVAQIGVLTEPSNWSNFDTVASITVDTASKWEEKEISLANYNGSGKYIALSLTSNSTSGIYYYIDDIIIDKIPNCIKPITASGSNITSSTATISWTTASVNDNAWMIKYKKSSSLNWDSLLTTTNPTIITNLDANSIYNIEVKTLCYDNSYSDGRSLNLATLCADISLIPYQENFDIYGTGLGTYPKCWSSIRSYQAAYPLIYYPAFSAPGALVFESNNSLPTVAISPKIDSSISINNLMVKFKMYNTTLSHKIQVGVMTNPSQYSTFVPVGNLQTITAINTWEDKTVSLAGYTGSGRYIALACVSTGTLISGYVDNFEIEYIPVCASPSVISFSNTNTSSTEINWTSGNSSDNTWWIYYKPNSSQVYDSVFVFTKPYILQNLSPNTKYDIYMITDCGGTISTASQVTSFTTECLPINSLPWSESFESITIAGGLPDCWKATNLLNMTNTQISDYSSYNRYAHTGTKSAYFNKGCDDSFFTPGFDLIAGTNYSFSYWYISDGANGWTNLSAGVYSSQKDTALIQNIGTPLANINNITYQKYIASFTPITSGTYFFGVKCKSNTSPNYLTIDDMKLEISTCVLPDSVKISSIKPTSVSMNWVAGNGTLWQVESKINTSSTWIKSTTSTNSLLFTNLIPNAQYQFRVATLCNGGFDTSAYITLSAKTPCLEISSFPYIENFDSWGTGTTAYPLCWSKYSYYSNSAPFITGTTDIYLYFPSNNNLQTYSIIGPIDDTIPINTLRIKYKMRSTSTSSNIQIGIITDRDSLSTFVAVGPINSSIVSGQWEVKEVPFSTYNGNGKYIVISSATPSSSYSEVYIDDVIIDYIPSCAKPTSILSDNPTTTSIDISWINGNTTDTSWWIFYKPVLSTNYDSVYINTQPPNTLTNLLSSTQYDFYIRTACSSDISEPTLLNSFYTSCGVVSTFPWNEDFEANWDVAYGISNSPRPNDCWVNINGGSNTTYMWRKSNSSQIPEFVRTGQGSAQLYGVNNSMGDYLMTPIVSLNGNQKITFWAKGYSSATTYPENIWIKAYNVSANGDINSYSDTTLLTDIAFINDTNQYTWKEYEYTLSNLVGNYRIVFARVNNIGCNFHIDDLTIADQPACSRPYSVSSSNPQSNQVIISWVPGSALDNIWRIFYRQVGCPTWDSVSVNSNPYSLLGLTPSSEYVYRVHTICDNGSLSDGREGTFRTSCGSISALPWYENFDTYGTGSTTYPTCWLKKSLGTTSPYTYTSGFIGNSLYFSVSSTSNYAIAMTPEISSTLPINTLKLDFKYKNTLAATDTLHIGIMSDTTETSWVEFAKITGTTIWTDYQVNLSNYIGIGKYIGFRVNPNSSGNSYGYLDNLVISSNITCTNPNTISVNNINLTSADISWNAGAGETNWQIKQGVNGIPIDVISTYYSATNLSQGTTYTYYVRSNCGSNIYSNWESIAFTTMTMPANPTVITSAVTTINHNSANLRGTYVQGLDAINTIGFEYKPTSSTIWTIQAVSQVTSPFSYSATGLTPSTHYKVRAYATTNAGTFYGDTASFITSAFNAPFVTTDSIKVYSDNTTAKFYGAILQGTESIISRGFEYKAASQDWSIAQELTATGTTSINANATGLVSGTNYDVRAYAETQSGKTYGTEINFVATSGLEDIDINTMTISLYPNPASTTTTLVVKGIVGEAKVLITDVQGRTINTFTMKSINGEATQEIKINGLAKGVYYLRIQNADTISSQKLIIR